MAIFAVPKRDDSLAQQVEHNTFNVGVLGSSPRRITKEASGNRSLFCLCILRRNPEMQPPCPRRGCPAWTHGARRWHLSTDGGIFVDAAEKCSRLSTQEVPGVDVRCLEVTFVHGESAQRGSSVPGGDFCPRRGCLAWMHGARRDKCYFRVIVSPGFTSPLIIFSASGSSI